MPQVNSFGAKDTLTVGSTEYEVFRIDKVPGSKRLPFSLKVLLAPTARDPSVQHGSRPPVEGEVRRGRCPAGTLSQTSTSWAVDPPVLVIVRR